MKDNNKGRKHYRILEEILFEHFPEFFPNKQSRKRALSDPNFFNIEHMVEVAMANVGGYNWVDATGYDFDDEDFSDAKTCTLRKHDSQFAIGRVERKIGSLRIVMYNEITDDIDYFYLTRLGRESQIEKGYIKADRNQERIRARYNESRKDYNKFEKFRVNSFTDLATMTDKKMEKRHPELKELLSKYDQCSKFVEFV